MTEQRFDARSPGEILRAAREKQGLHIAALAAAIKVAPRKLDALEHDRWDELPDATFVRALAQTVCRTLKIDAQPVLQLLPRSNTMALEPQSATHNVPFRERGGRDEPGLSLGAVRPMLIAATLLMLAAVALYFVPERLWADRFGLGAKPEAAAAPQASPAAVAATTPVEAIAPAPPAASEPMVVAVAPSPRTDAQVAVLSPAPAASATAPGPVAVSSAPLTGSGLLQLRSTANSWIEAREATGRVVFSRVVTPGESVDVDGKLPIKLTIGNAAVTQLAFRGQPYDLGPSTRDNVARLELK